MIIQKLLKMNVNLNSINQINNYIANLNVVNNSKRMYLYQINKYLSANGMSNDGLLKIPQEFKAEKKSLTFDEVQIIKNTDKTLETDFVFNALSETGARLNEFTQIDWCNTTSEQIGIKTLKVSNNHRYIFISSSTLEKLNLLKLNNFDFSKLTFKRIQYLLAKLGKLANLSINLSPQVLRRTKGTILRLNGCPLEDIADTLGHQNLETTRKFYTKMNPEYLKSVSKLSEIKPVEAINVQLLISELKILKRKLVLLELENEKLSKDLREYKCIQHNQK